jgi:acetyl-CoA carboxylase biotin carboxyl carrier protein
LLTFEQIKELIELVAERKLDGLKVERSGFTLKIRGRQSTPPATVAAAPVMIEAAPRAVAPAAPPSTSADAAADTTAGETGDDPTALPPDAHILTSPIVGTFYRAPSPDSDAYVEVGSRVSQGQHLCVVEAMKVMNEIEADVSGVIVQIFPQNAQPVEFGEPLFAIKTG